MNKQILVVGGAGYIGSHMVKCLRMAGHTPVVLDNLSSGNAAATVGAELIHADAGDAAMLDSIFSQRRFDAIMHFASYIEVGRSVIDPSSFYENNVARTITLLDAMARHKLSHFVFSSTAAVFGNPRYLPLDEAHPTQPVNPYGNSKLMVEMMLDDYARAYGMQYGVLRYFNACGADPEGQLGECHEPETHLIPLILQAASGRRACISVFGNDYATADGTCIRDYVHVTDLADAHLRLLEYSWSGGTQRHFNLGTGTGHSVLEVIRTVEEVTGRSITVKMEPRRAGDPESLVASGTAARDILGWNPQYSDLRTIITHAWAWEKRLQNGHPFAV